MTPAYPVFVLKKLLPEGFTLIELMVGIALGIVVLGSVLAVYQPALRSWESSASLAQIHDAESIIHDVFGAGIRQAGLLACGRNSMVIDGVGITSYRGDTAKWALRTSDFLKTSFQAFSAGDNVSSSLSHDIQNNRLKNNISTGSTFIGDVFYVLAPSRGFYRIESGSTAAGTKALNLSIRGSKDIDFKAGELFIVNDCDNPVVIRTSKNAHSTYDSNTGISAITLSYSNQVLNGVEHPRNTVVNVFEPAIYYLRAKSGVPTLYKATIIKTASTDTPLTLVHAPILTGVENMRVEYGIADSAGNYIDHYETVAGQTGQGNTSTPTLSNVLSVRITIMIQAPGEVSRQSNLSFPNLKGEQRYCFKQDSESAKEGFKDACPDFLSPAIGGAKTHKVIRFTYLLPRIVSI